MRIRSRRLSLSFRAILVAILILVVVTTTQNASACTAFLQEGLFAGKNYDWTLDQGLLIANKRGIAKRALLLDPAEKPAEWVSKYGSVTFNQYGREMPNGGMNEVGLVVESLMLPTTRNPTPDDRPAVTAWAQYQLDNSQTVGDVIASDKAIRISPAMPMPIHFFVCDAEGGTAVVEFIDGKMVAHTGKDLPHKLITNDTCDTSLAFLIQHEGFGGNKPIRQGSQNSLDRFAIAADRLKGYEPDGSTESAIQYAFTTLTTVRQGQATKWSIVYDLKSFEIHYKTERCQETRIVRLKDLDFSPQTAVRMVSINTPHTGLLNPHFADYDPDLNKWLIYYCIRHTPMLSLIPDQLLEQLAHYPEATILK